MTSRSPVWLAAWTKGRPRLAADYQRFGGRIVGHAAERHVHCGVQALPGGLLPFPAQVG